MKKERNQLSIAFGTVLKNLRAAEKISQQELADFSEVDRIFISKMERGISAPSIVVFWRLSRYLRRKPQNFMKMVEAEMLKMDMQKKSNPITLANG